jgi:hypothetical protein
VVVTVIAVRTMRVPLHQIFDVVAVGKRGVSTVRSVDVGCSMGCAVVKDASLGVGG